MLLTHPGGGAFTLLPRPGAEAIFRQKRHLLSEIYRGLESESLDVKGHFAQVAERAVQRGQGERENYDHEHGTPQQHMNEPAYQQTTKRLKILLNEWERVPHGSKTLPANIGVVMEVPPESGSTRAEVIDTIKNSLKNIERVYQPFQVGPFLVVGVTCALYSTNCYYTSDLTLIGIHQLVRLVQFESRRDSSTFWWLA